MAACGTDPCINNASNAILLFIYCGSNKHLNTWKHLGQYLKSCLNQIYHKVWHCRNRVTQLPPMTTYRNSYRNKFYAVWWYWRLGPKKKVWPGRKYKWFIIKGIVHPKIKMYWKCAHPHAIQDVDEFVSSWEQIWRNVALHQLLTNRSSAVNGCRQN